MGGTNTMKGLCVALALGVVGCGTVDEEQIGPPGPQGEQGPAGEMGTAGESVAVVTEAAGANCTTGGFKLVSSSGTSYVCNGTNGADAVAPAGSVVAFAGAQAPSGWILCDGAAVSRTTYSGLFAAIGTAWGEGDASTTFNLPDMRGRFLRGADKGAGRDPEAGSRAASAPGGNIGDRVGTSQGDQLRSHAHPYSGAFTTEPVVSGHPQGGTATPYTMWGYGNTTSAVGGTENRPTNVTVNYIIKY